MIEKLKNRFPVFSKNPNLVFFDTAASALKVDSMIKAVNECYSFEYANIHRGIYELSSKLTKRYEDARLAVSKFINSQSSENIIFTKSATEGINLVASCLSENYFNDGDEVLSYSTNPNLEDTSGDGLADGVVVNAGFDPTVDYSNLANPFRQGMADLRAGSTILQLGPNNSATLELQIERSNDLSNWTTNTDDLVEVQIPLNGDTEFFRFKMTE